MEIKQFDLFELYGHFANVAEENNRILLQLETLEKKFKPLTSGDEIDMSLILENGMKIDIKAYVRKHSEMHGMEHHH